MTDPCQNFLFTTSISALLWHLSQYFIIRMVCFYFHFFFFRKQHEAILFVRMCVYRLGLWRSVANLCERLALTFEWNAALCQLGVGVTISTDMSKRPYICVIKANIICKLKHSEWINPKMKNLLLYITLKGRIYYFRTTLPLHFRNNGSHHKLLYLLRPICAYGV